MRADLDSGEWVVWYVGSHTANVYRITDEPTWIENIECFEFAHEKNRTSMLDFTKSLQNWMEYNAG